MDPFRLVLPDWLHVLVMERDSGLHTFLVLCHYELIIHNVHLMLSSKSRAPSICDLALLALVRCIGGKFLYIIALPMILSLKV